MVKSCVRMRTLRDMLSNGRRHQIRANRLRPTKFIEFKIERENKTENTFSIAANFTIRFPRLRDKTNCAVQVFNLQCDVWVCARFNSYFVLFRKLRAVAALLLRSTLDAHAWIPRKLIRSKEYSRYRSWLWLVDSLTFTNIQTREIQFFDKRYGHCRWQTSAPSTLRPHPRTFYRKAKLSSEFFSAVEIFYPVGYLAMAPCMPNCTMHGLTLLVVHWKWIFDEMSKPRRNQCCNLQTTQNAMHFNTNERAKQFRNFVACTLHTEW